MIDYEIGNPSETASYVLLGLPLEALRAIEMAAPRRLESLTTVTARISSPEEPIPAAVPMWVVNEATGVMALVSVDTWVFGQLFGEPLVAEAFSDEYFEARRSIWRVARPLEGQPR